ncbi:hypothetical protein Poly30_33380 [Planctomycetes bacterium Poly30]|uniref:Uncharacterized protein n=1 Tax=Saltatorellus ferox TaxID=2528018 RepID=A0A518EUM1_9BACT|nr:hypothetical protein Poly30_33380 [Planctomycetes bacterium Poly30]
MDDPPDIFRGTGGRSPLQNFVRAHLPGFLAAFEDEHGGRSLPKYVIQEFEALLECGDPAFGFSRLRRPSCSGLSLSDTREGCGCEAQAANFCRP